MNVWNGIEEKQRKTKIDLIFVKSNSQISRIYGMLVMFQQKNNNKTLKNAQPNLFL